MDGLTLWSGATSRFQSASQHISAGRYWFARCVDSRTAGEVGGGGDKGVAESEVVGMAAEGGGSRTALDQREQARQVANECRERGGGGHYGEKREVIEMEGSIKLGSGH